MGRIRYHAPSRKTPVGVAGIYQIVDTGGRCYIGSSQDMFRRWEGHQYQLRRGSHHAIRLQRGWNELGESAFTLKVIETVPNSDDLKKWEQFYIDSRQPYYNTSREATRPDVRPEVLDDRREKRERADLLDQIVAFTGANEAADTRFQTRPQILCGRVSNEVHALLHDRNTMGMSVGCLLQMIGQTMLDGMTVNDLVRLLAGESRRHRVDKSATACDNSGQRVA